MAITQTQTIQTTQTINVSPMKAEEPIALITTGTYKKKKKKEIEFILKTVLMERATETQLLTMEMELATAIQL